MLKVTENGIDSGPIRELTEEELDFIEDMFKEHSDYEREFHNVKISLYGSI